MNDNGVRLCFFDSSDLGYLSALVFRRTANWCSAWCTGYQYGYGYLLRWSTGKDYSATKMTGTAM